MQDTINPAAAVTAAEQNARQLHDAGRCSESEWSCSFCEAIAAGLTVECPEWCTDHNDYPADYRESAGDFFMEHRRGWPLSEWMSEAPVRVDEEVRVEGAPRRAISLWVDYEQDSVTALQARQLARALLEAADALDLLEVQA